MSRGALGLNMQTRELSSFSAYRAGRGVEEVAREVGLDPSELLELGSNENPHGPSPAALDAVHEAAGSANSYPKAVHTDLTAAIADEWDLAPAQVWLGPGADGALDYLARAVLTPGDRTLAPQPGFSYYQMSTRYHAGQIDYYQLPREDGFEQSAERVLAAHDDHRLIYITTPHSPTGTELSLTAIEAIAESVPETLVVVDEAYGEYTDQPSARTLLAAQDNIAVTRTFSKAYGLAGLRVGYAMVPTSWAATYERINTPFAVNRLACRAGLAALDDDEHLEQTVSTSRWARSYIREELDAPTWPSKGNYVLANVGDGAAVAAAARQRGVIVRDCASFGLSDCIRISTGTREGTRTAVARLNEVV